MNFTDLGLSEALVNALAIEEITQPMPIQSEAVPALISGRDAYVSAETGTGKTLAYLLPLFMRMDPALPQVQAIVLAPTHELASQIRQQADQLARNAGLPIRSLLLIGGANPQRQIEKLKKKPHLVVGSTGRILELIRMKKLKIRHVGAVVVDEADRLLLSEGLVSVREIIAAVPEKPQLIFVSATEQAAASTEAEKLSSDLVRLTAGANQINPDIRHLFFVGEDRDKPDLLRRLIHATDPERAIVFVHRAKEVEQLRAKMENYSIPTVDIHGTTDKLERKSAMDAIRSGKVRILIASDIAARGLDIKGVTHIFNYDVPSESRDYLHRAGRTGRAGQEGYAISLMNERERRISRRYEAELGIRMHEAVLREGQIYAADE